MVSRRIFLSSAASVLGAGLSHPASALPPSGAASASASALMPLFIQLSSVLTGFAADTLAPPQEDGNLNQVDLKQVYLSLLQDKLGPNTVAALFDVFRRITQAPPATWAARVKTDIMDGYGLGEAARHLIKLWYTGAWDDGIVSSAAYTHGLLWDSIQAHPPGYSAQGFGYWAHDPLPPLPGPASNGAGV
jgi:hypothetical protein